MTPTDVISRFFTGIEGKSKYLESKHVNEFLIKLVRSDNVIVAYIVKYGNTRLLIYRSLPLDYVHHRYESNKVTALWHDVISTVIMPKEHYTADLTADIVAALICIHIIGEPNQDRVTKIKRDIKIYETIKYDCGHEDSSEVLDTYGKNETFSINEDGSYKLDKQGLPIVEVKSLCKVCVSKLKAVQDISPSGHRTGYLKPVKSKTFNKWPFTTNVGLELELVKVLPLSRSIFDNYAISIMQDPSIKFSGTNMSNIPIKVPIAATKYTKGIEVCTHPRNGDLFFDTINGLMTELAPVVRVNNSCALHVHADWSHLSDEQKIPASLFLKLMDRVMFAIQPKTRYQNSFSRPSDIYTVIDSIKKINQLVSWTIGHKYDGVSFVHGGNPNSPGVDDKLSYGTVEFRMATGSRNTKKILMWTQMVSRMMELAETTSPSDLKDIVKKVYEHDTLSIGNLISVFFSLAKQKDLELNRPPEFLEQLKEWYMERQLKFKVFTTDPKPIDVSLVFIKTKEDKPTFNEAKVVQIEDVISVYETMEGLEGTG